MLVGWFLEDCGNTNLLLTKVIRKIGHHDLCGRWNAVLWGSSLLWWARSSGFCVRRRSGLLVGLCGNIGQGERVFSEIGGGSSGTILIGQSVNDGGMRYRPGLRIWRLHGHDHLVRDHGRHGLDQRISCDQHHHLRRRSRCQWCSARACGQVGQKPCVRGYPCLTSW